MVALWKVSKALIAANRRLRVAMGVAAFVLEVVEERGDAPVVDVGEVERVGRDLCAFGEEGEQQCPGVAVGPDRGRAQCPLGEHVGGEVLLQDWGETVGHHPSWSLSRRPAAIAATSGAAWRYQ